MNKTRRTARSSSGSSVLRVGLLAPLVLSIAHCGSGGSGDPSESVEAIGGSGGSAASTGATTSTGGAGVGGAGTGGAMGIGAAGTGGAMAIGAAGTGGATGTGGAQTGGATGTGGAQTGGATDTGGAQTGGATDTGGAQTGGATDTGGAQTGGVPATGGAQTGGVPDTGGAETGGVPGAGGAQTGGVSGNGGAATGGATGTGGRTSGGDLCVTDPVPGFASVEGGTTGGGTDLSSAITVNSMTALQEAAKGSNAAIILVELGNYSGSLSPGSNKTIIGKGPGVTITGNIKMSGAAVHNLIVRNLAVRGQPCGSYEECKSGDDAVYIGNEAHHIWLDHLDIADGQDGNCDISHGANNITVSWTHFHYTYDKEHRYSNLIAGSDDEPDSAGKLHITYMSCHWGERVDQRQPRGRYGNIHLLNNYHDTGGSQIHGVGKDMAAIAENCFYDEGISIWKDMGSPRGWNGIGNEGTAADMNDSRGTVFDIPYSYTPMSASQAKSAVTSPDCGAGNTCTLGDC